MSFDKRRALQNALLYTQQGKWDRAIAEYQAILKADPSDLTVCNNLGDLYARAGRLAEAIEQYRKLGESYRTDGLSVKAIAVYKKIAKLDPTWTEAYAACGDLYIEQGLVGEAKLQFATAAQLYAKAGETAKVVEIYQRLAQLDPSNLSLLTKLADLLAKQGSPAAAAAEYERAAQAAEAAGQAADAKRLLKKARELAPAPVAGSTLAQGEALLAEGKADAACEVLARVTAEQPDTPQAWRLLADAEAARGHPEQALAALEAGISHGLAEGEVADPLSRALLAAGRADDAAALCERLVQDALGRGEAEEALGRCTALLAAAPSLLDVHGRRVEILETLGREAEAVAARRALAEAYEAAGQPEAAVRAYEALLARVPGDEAARARLAALAPPAAAADEADAAATVAAEPDLGDFELLLEEPGLLDETAALPAGDAESETLALPSEPELVAIPDVQVAPLVVEEAVVPTEAAAAVPAAAAPEEPDGPLAAEDALPLTALPLEDAAALPVEAAPLAGLETLAFGQEDAGPSPPDGLPVDEPVSPVEMQAEVTPSGLFVAEEPGEPAPGEPAGGAEPPPADFTLSGDGSLDFLGGTVGLGGLPMDEDDAPSGQAAEQLAEADVYLKYGLEDKARERLVEVVRLSPNSVTVRRKLKNLYREQRQVDEACEQIVAIAKILGERRRAEAAREEILEGLDFAPDHPGLRRLLEGPGPQAPPAPEAPPAEPSGAAAVAPAAEAGQPSPPEGGGPEAAPPIDLPAGPVVLELELPGVTEDAGPVLAAPEEPVPASEPAEPGPGTPAGEADVGLAGEVELPPELAALLNQPEDAGLVVVPADGTEGVADDLAEARFYLAQGMEEEAREVARRLEASFPDHPDVVALLARLGGAAPSAGPFGSLMFAEPAAPADVGGVPLSELAAAAAAREAEGAAPDAPPAAAVHEAGESGETFVDLGAELDQELGQDADPEAPRSEAALVDGLLTELQRGVREQVDAKDFETHYNLGIAYKEMDLYDEAIQEFRLAAADPKRVLECADLLGQCHLAKGQPQQAVGELRAGLDLPGHPPEAHRSLRYGLALAYEALGEDPAALQELERLAAEDPRFRDVQSRLQALRARLPRRARLEAAPAAPARPAAPPRERKPRKISFI